MLLLLLLAAALAAPSTRLTVGEDAWFVADAHLATGSTELALTRGYAFPLERDGRTVGWAWTGSGAQRVLPSPGVDLAGIARRELGAEPDADGGWTAPADVVWALGPGVRPGGPGWERVGTGTDGTELLVAPAAEVRAARVALQLAVPDRAAALPTLGYPVDEAVGLADPDFLLVEARVAGPVSRVAGNDASADRGWTTSMRADPLLLAGMDATAVLGARWVFPPADC